MFFSLEALGLNRQHALLASLIPLVLGVIDIMTATAFSLAGCVFIIAIAAHVFPMQYQFIQALVANRIEQAGAATQISGSNTATNNAPRLSGSIALANHSPDPSGSNSSSNNSPGEKK